MNRQDYVGLNFCMVDSDSIVQFDFQTLGENNLEYVLRGPGLKHSPAVPFTFSVRPRVDD